MIWMKHRRNFREDLRCQRLLEKFGQEAYGLLWTLYEMYCGEFTTFQETPPLSARLRRFAMQTYTTEEGFDNMTREMANLGLIIRRDTEDGFIEFEAPILFDMLDETQSKKQRTSKETSSKGEKIPIPERFRNDSGTIPDKKKSRREGEEEGKRREKTKNITDGEKVLQGGEEGNGKMNTCLFFLFPHSHIGITLRKKASQLAQVCGVDNAKTIIQEFVKGNDVKDPDLLERFLDERKEFPAEDTDPSSDIPF